MYVKMARTMAARGLTSLRFDVSGIGDSVSDAKLENRLYAPEAVEDVRAAMTELTELREVAGKRDALILEEREKEAAKQAAQAQEPAALPAAE